MTLNIVAIALSALALVSSTYLALRQVVSTRQANFVPVYVSFLNEMRTAEFHDRYYYICERLQREHDPRRGISGLPEQTRRTVYDIAYYFQLLITFRRLQILDGHVLDTMYGRIVRVWTAIAPFVERERRLKGDHGPELLCILENYATAAARRPPVVAKTMLHRPPRRPWPG